MKLSAGLAFQCIWSILSVAVFAAETPVSVDQLKKTLASYQKIQRLEVPFHQTKTLNEMHMSLESDGRLTLVRPSKVTWEILKPAPMKVEMNEKEIRLTDDKGTQVLDANAGPAAQSLKSLVAWMKLDADALAKEDQVFLVKPHVYRFVPRVPGGSPFSSIELTLNTNDQPRTILLSEKSGDTMRIDFGIPKTVSTKK